MSISHLSRDAALARDASDPLAPLRDQFVIPDDVIYLDGNSLGVMPRDTAARVAQTVEREWGVGLIGSWNTAGWIDRPLQVGDKLARLIGATPGSVAAADSTSVNLFKVLHAALALRDSTPADAVILSERDNFPTDLYIASSVASSAGLRLELVDGADLISRLADAGAAPVAITMLTHVNYRTGAMYDMAAVTAATHAAGAISVWDLAHSAGAVEVDLTAAGADLAIGCGYKYLNGGPGAPAFVWVSPRHIDRALQPLTGWMGHAAPFEFSVDYRRADGIRGFLCGTPPVIALAALDAGIDTLLAAEPLGGMAALRAKSVALTSLFLEAVAPVAAANGLGLVGPDDPGRRGSQISLAAEAGNGYAIMQALIERGVVGDFRAPEILRFGFTPLYTRFVDVIDAVAILDEVLTSGLWREERFARRAAVT